MFFCRDALDIAGMSDIAQDAADKIQDDFMDKMEMFALYYVGKYDHSREAVFRLGRFCRERRLAAFWRHAF